jgi:hypothetical protein
MMYLYVLLLLLSCGQSEQPTVLDRWKINPNETIEWLKSQPPLVQIDAFQKLVDFDPTTLKLLCTDQDLSAIQSQCHFLKDRPHLLVKPERVDQGHHSRIIYDQSKLSELWALDSIAPSDCSETAGFLCVFESAGVAAQESTHSAAVICNSLEDHLKAECYFHAAESLKGNKDLPKQLELCYAATPYSNRCLTHILDQLSNPYPPVHLLTDSEIESLLEVNGLLSGLDNPWQKRFTGMFWSAVTLHMLEQSVPNCSGRLIELPIDLRAYWLANLIYLKYNSTSGTLEERVNLTEHLIQPCVNSTHQLTGPPNIHHYWDLNESQDLNTKTTSQIPFVRYTQREWHSNTIIDFTLMWIEAAAQHEDWPIVEEGVTHSQPVVKNRALQIMSHKRK